MGEMHTNLLHHIRFLCASKDLPSPRAAAFSPDGRFLAFSVRSRGAIWDLSTGKQLAVIRPFRHAWIDNQYRFYVQFEIHR